MNYLSEVYSDSGIYAKTVCASISNGIPIYTLEIQAPKYLNAELNTHRMLSKNYSSSRAIPLSNSLDAEYYIPLDLRKNQSGMQGYKYVSDAEKYNFYKHLNELYNYIDDLLISSDMIANIHKQHLNRYIEPFLLQKGIITATEWDNFFNLRLSPDAQPEIQELARCMKEAIDQATPTELNPGDWHVPYMLGGIITPCDNIDEWIKCSVARCARVSYNNVDNSAPDIDKDLALYDKLLSSKHLSCFEHQATPMKIKEINHHLLIGHIMHITGIDELSKPLESGITHVDRDSNLWSGNFRSWIQYRQLVSDWNG